MCNANWLCNKKPNSNFHFRNVHHHLFADEPKLRMARTQSQTSSDVWSFVTALVWTVNTEKSRKTFTVRTSNCNFTFWIISYVWRYGAFLFVFHIHTQREFPMHSATNSSKSSTTMWERTKLKWMQFTVCCRQHARSCNEENATASAHSIVRTRSQRIYRTFVVARAKAFKSTQFYYFRFAHKVFARVAYRENSNSWFEFAVLHYRWCAASYSDVS